MNNIEMMTTAMTHVALSTKNAGINTDVTNLIQDIFKKTIANGYGKNGLVSIIEILKKHK